MNIEHCKNGSNVTPFQVELPITAKMAIAPEYGYDTQNIGL